MGKVTDLVNHWRTIGPAAWAEGTHGWIDVGGNSISLSSWQRVVLDAWWQNRETVTTLAISNIKKTGKTFTNAVLLAWRWLAMPGEHFAVGNDLDQSAGRQFQQIAEMVRRHPYLKRSVKVTGKGLTFNPTGSVITALSVDAAGNAGANHLTASHTEAWGIIYDSGIEAYEELTTPPGRFYGLPAMRICDSYAGYEGQSDTWHNLVDRGLSGEHVSEDWPIYQSGGLLLFHMDGAEAQERCFRDTPDEADKYYSDQRAVLRPGAFLRLHENKPATGAEQFIELDAWDACVDDKHRPILPAMNPGALFVGVDAGIKHDSAAIVAVEADREEGKIKLVRHRIWKPSARDPLDIDGTIGEFLRMLRSAYRLRLVYYDPYQLHDLSHRLETEGLPMVEFPQSVPNLTAMGQNLYELIKSGNLMLYPDEEMRSHAAHAIAVESSRGWRIAKEKSSHKIDSVVALAMAALAAVESQGVGTWEDVEGLGHLEDFESPWIMPGIEESLEGPFWRR